MKIALQVGAAWLVGVAAFLGLGILMILVIAAKSAGGVAVVTGIVVALYLLIGLAVWDGRWYQRLAWGFTVGLFGVVGSVFLVKLAGNWDLPRAVGFLIVGLPYAVAAALWARNWWVRGAGVLVLISALAFAPAETYTGFLKIWTSLR